MNPLITAAVGTSGEGGKSEAASGAGDALRVVQTLLAAQVITHGNGGGVPKAPAEGALPAPAISRAPKPDLGRTAPLPDAPSATALAQSTPRRGRNQ